MLACVEFIGICLLEVALGQIGEACRMVGEQAALQGIYHQCRTVAVAISLASPVWGSMHDASSNVTNVQTGRDSKCWSSVSMPGVANWITPWLLPASV